MRREMGEQAAEQRHIRAGRQRQMQVRILAGGGAARVEHHQPDRALGARGLQALVEHRMAPGGVGTDQNNHVRQFQIVIHARNQVLAKGASMPGHRAGHAQAGVAVDIGRAEHGFG